MITVKDYLLFVACTKAAASNDVRYYLNGVLIDAKRGEVTGTDGHRLLRAACLEPDPEGPEPFLLQLQGRLPAKVPATCWIDPDKMEIGGSNIRVPYAVGEGTYPEVDRVLGGNLEEEDVIAFNQELVCDLAKVVKAQGVAFGVTEDKGKYRVRFLKSVVTTNAYTLVVIGTHIDDVVKEELATIDPSRTLS